VPRRRIAIAWSGVHVSIFPKHDVASVIGITDKPSETRSRLSLPRRSAGRACDGENRPEPPRHIHFNDFVRDHQKWSRAEAEATDQTNTGCEWARRDALERGGEDYSGSEFVASLARKSVELMLDSIGKSDFKQRLHPSTIPVLPINR
jgi:hypothetical protein